MFQAYYEKGNLSIFIEERFCHNSVRVFVKFTEGARDFLLVPSPDRGGEIEMKLIEQGEAIMVDDHHHLMELRRDLFVALLEAMTKYAKSNGIEPDSLAELKATLKAKEEHLEDLRSLLEQKMSIQLPNRRITRAGQDGK